MKKFAGSPERLRGKSEINDQINPSIEADSEVDVAESGDLYEGILAREELKKVVETYFKYLTEQGVSPDKENKDEVVEECKVLLRDILKIEKINNISRKGLWRMLGQICREETKEIDHGKKFTDDKTLGESIFEDIAQRANGHHEFGIS